MAVGNGDNSRLVYSSDLGRVPEPAKRPAAAGAPAGDGVVRVGRTKAGRKGKTVTVVTGVPPADVAKLAVELKRFCGSGGAVKDGAIEIQGDHRERIVARLADRYRTKLAGG